MNIKVSAWHAQMQLEQNAAIVVVADYLMITVAYSCVFIIIAACLCIQYYYTIELECMVLYGLYYACMQAMFRFTLARA